MAMVYAGFVQLVNEMGLSPAIVQYRELTSRQVGQLGGLALLAGVALFALSLGLSGAIAAFFGEPVVRWIIVALSLTFIVRALQVVPRSLLARDLEFRRLAWINAGEAFVWGFTPLLGALLGLGFWARVLGAVVSGAAATAVLSTLRPHHLSWPGDIRSIAKAVHLGWYIVVSQLCWYVYSHADLTIVGRVLGKAPLGAYTKGWDIASVPTDRISTLVGQVTPAVFSAAQKDQVALRRYLLALTEGLALLTFPLSVGLALVADLFVITVLGEQWRAAIVPVRLLGLYGGFRAIFNTLPQMLVATGHAKENMRFNLFAAVAVPTPLYIGSRWGTTGVALAWIAGYPLIPIPTFSGHTLRILALRPSAYLRALWRAATAAAGIAVAVLLLRAVIPPAWPAGLRLVMEVLGGAGGYVSVLLVAHGSRHPGLTARLRHLARRAAPPPTRLNGPSAARARLLLITYHFPPDAAVGALRWQKLARHAAERGWGLDVIALHPAQVKSADPDRLADLPAGVRVYGIPLPRARVEQIGFVVWRLYDWARRVRRWVAPARGSLAEAPLEAPPRAASRWVPRDPPHVAPAGLPLLSVPGHR